MLLKLVDILHFYITQGIHQQFNGGDLTPVAFLLTLLNNEIVPK